MTHLNSIVAQAHATIAGLHTTISALQAEIEDAHTLTRARADEQVAGTRQAQQQAHAEEESARARKHEMVEEEVQRLETEVVALQEQVQESQERSVAAAGRAVASVHARAAAHIAEVEAELGRLQLALGHAHQREREREREKERDACVEAQRERDHAAHELARLRQQQHLQTRLQELRDLAGGHSQVYTLCIVLQCFFRVHCVAVPLIYATYPVDILNSQLAAIRLPLVGSLKF